MTTNSDTARRHALTTIVSGGANRVFTMRRLLCILLAATVIAGISSSSASAARPRNTHDAPTATSTRKHSTLGRMRVLVGDLPRGTRASVTVRGPHRFRREISASTTLTLPPGVYTVDAAPVSARSGSYYAGAAHQRQQVSARKTTTVAVTYGVLVPHSTHVIPTSATRSLVGEPSSPRTLTLSGTTANEARTGEILASAPSAAAPNGYLVKVMSIHNSAGRIVLGVTNASLLEAVPDGEINAEQALSAPAEPSSDSLLMRGRVKASPLAHAADLSLETTNLTCQTSAGVHVHDPRISFSPSIALKAHWGFFKLDSASVSLTVAATISMGATADAGATCSTNDPGIGLLPEPVKLPTIDIQVGPVPVVIAPELQVYLSGSASVTASASLSLEQSASATLGATYEHGAFKPFDSFPSHFTKSFAATGNAQGELALRPTVDTLIYGVAGPSFDVGVAGKFDANTSKTPWWKLEGCLQGGVGFIMPLLGIDWSAPHLLDACTPLLTASTPPPAPPPPPPPPHQPPISFEGNPGTEAAPTSLGPYTMQTMDPAPGELGEAFSEIEGPTGTIGFSEPFDYARVGEGWQTWSNGYTGAVFEIKHLNSEGIVEGTLTLPPNTGAFYLYAEPDEFENFSVTATTEDGATSGPTTVFGEYGAKYLGFYASCGTAITTIRLTDGEGDPALGIGEFAIAPTMTGC